VAGELPTEEELDLMAEAYNEWEKTHIQVMTRPRAIFYHGYLLGLRKGREDRDSG